MASTTTNRPTSRQLSYLKALAERTGQTFTYPHTSRQASDEINRLKHTRPSSHGELEIEREIADAVTVGERDAARVRNHEIDGYGSSATWAHNRHHDPAPSSDRPAPKRTTPVVGKRTGLARYTISAGERILYGQRIDGIVRFLPGSDAVLVALSDLTEDDSCRLRKALREVGRADAARHKRLNGARPKHDLLNRGRA